MVADEIKILKLAIRPRLLSGRGRDQDLEIGDSSAPPKKSRTGSRSLNWCFVRAAREVADENKIFRLVVWLRAGDQRQSKTLLKVRTNPSETNSLFPIHLNAVEIVTCIRLRIWFVGALADSLLALASARRNSLRHYLLDNVSVNPLQGGNDRTSGGFGV